MKTAELRKQFKELTGFPLVRANAEVFVPKVGDLRRVENLKIVVKAVVASISEKDELIAELKSEIASLKAEVEEKQEVPPVDEIEVVAAACVEVSEPVAEQILSAMLTSDKEQTKTIYRKLARAFHPDSTRLEKEKAARCFAIVTEIVEKYTKGIYGERREPVNSRNESQSEFVSTEELWNDIKDL